MPPTTTTASPSWRPSLQEKLRQKIRAKGVMGNPHSQELNHMSVICGQCFTGETGAKTCEFGDVQKQQDILESTTSMPSGPFSKQLGSSLGSKDSMIQFCRMP